MAEGRQSLTGISTWYCELKAPEETAVTGFRISLLKNNINKGHKFYQLLKCLNWLSNPKVGNINIKLSLIFNNYSSSPNGL